MKNLKKSIKKEIIIIPKWPFKEVFISEAAYHRLLLAQSKLASHSVKLVLKRGYESQGVFIKMVYRTARIFGAILFSIIYPNRLLECKEIFSANGHNKTGNCIDIGIMYEDNILKLLPYGVFTSRTQIESILSRHKHLVETVWTELELVGFCIHKNQTEALQIHCELNRNFVPHR